MSMRSAAMHESAGHVAADRILTLDALQRDLQASRLREQRLKVEVLNLQMALSTAQSLIYSMLMGPARERPN